MKPVLEGVSAAQYEAQSYRKFRYKKWLCLYVEMFSTWHAEYMPRWGEPIMSIEGNSKADVRRKINNHIQRWGW